MKTSLLTAALGLAVLAAGPSRADDKSTGDLAKLQGKWTTKYGPEGRTTLTLVIAGKSVEATFISNQGGGGVAMKGEVAVNEAAKPNNTIDFTGFKRPDGDSVAPDLGIYVIEDDNTIKVCAGGPGKDRPAEFKTEEGGPRVVVLKRQPAATATAETKPGLKGDLAKFQGKWTGKAGPDKAYAVTAVIAGKACTAKVTTPEGQEFEVKGELALNETAKPHKTIDWKKFQGPNGDELPDNPGIYTFKDDNTIEICNGGPGKERPTEFKNGEGEDPQLFTLKREPAAKKADAPAPAAAAKGDLAKFQGHWTAKAGPEKNVDVNIIFKGDAVSVAFTTPEGQERSMKGVVALDEAAKPHKTISFKGFTRQDGSDAPDSLGIYAFDGNDSVRICTGGPGNERPTEFKAGEDGPPRLIELKRKK